jgi:hypothetical protein
MDRFAPFLCLVMALGIAWNILTFVKAAPGTACYYLGTAIENCIHPGFYYGAWMIAVAFLLWGMAGMLERRL